MLKNIKANFKKILPHKMEDNYHYGRFIGSFNFFRLISWNFFHPIRVISRFLWKTIKDNKKKKINSFEEKKINFKKKIETNKLDYFIENGGVLIKNFFSNEEIDNFLDEYDYLISLNKEKLKNKIKEKNIITEYNKIKLYLSKPLLDIWLNTEVIEFIKCFLGTDKIYAREYPRLVYTKYLYEEPLSSRNMHKGNYKNLIINGPYFWHIDHTAGLVNFHVLLDNVDVLTTTCMQFLPGSNKYFNTRDLYSDETVDRFKNRPVNCVGDKGTIYFHQGNTLHRVVGKTNSERLGLIFSFSKGAGIEFDVNQILYLLSKGYGLDKLTEEQRQILSGLIPNNQVINIKNNNIFSTVLSEES